MPPTNKAFLVAVLCGSVRGHRRFGVTSTSRMEQQVSLKRWIRYTELQGVTS